MAEPTTDVLATAKPLEDLAHELWAAAQTVPGEGIDDATARIAALLRDHVCAEQPAAGYTLAVNGLIDHEVFVPTTEAAIHAASDIGLNSYEYRVVPLHGKEVPIE